MTVLEEAGVQSPERHVRVLQNIIWTDISRPIWDCRNSIQHKSRTKFSKAEDEKMSARLQWYH